MPDILQISENPENIEYIKNIHILELEPLYWALEDCYHDGELKRATSVFQMLCCIAKNKKELLINSLNRKKIERIKQLGSELYDSKSYSEQTAIEMKFATLPVEIPFQKESQLRDYLYQNCSILKIIDKDINRVFREYKLDYNFSCDLIAESNSTCYPIELKIKQSTHSVVSQIEKYCYFMYRRLRYDHYKNVQGIVISNGFDAWSINELRRKNIWIYDVGCGEDNKVGIKKIKDLKNERSLVNEIC